MRPAYVIGADGYDSAVRRMAGIEMAEHRAAQVFSIYEIEAAGELPTEARVIFDPDLTSVYWPLEQGRCRWGFQIRASSEHAASMGRLEQLIAARAPWCTARPTQIYWSTLGLFESRLTRSFGKGAFEGVTHVQRVNTRGGIPPERCDSGHIDQLLRVEFSADFIFYRPRSSAAG